MEQYKIDKNIENKAKNKIFEINKQLTRKTEINLKKTFNSIINIMEDNYDTRKVIQLQFTTKGCSFKKVGSCWNCNYGVFDTCTIDPNQYIDEFKKCIQKIEGDVLVLETMGSITDENEFDQNVLRDVLKIAIDSKKFIIILMETHISKIKEEFVKYISELNNGRCKIGFEVGIEDMNPENRKLINKIGVDNKKIKDVYDMLEKHNMLLNINLIYGFPFMQEKERTDELYSSVKIISKTMPKADIVIFLMSIKENTIMELMYKKGIYKMPNPWGFVNAINKILQDNEIKNFISFSWFGEKDEALYLVKEKRCYTCPKCEKKIIDFCSKISGTFDFNEKTNYLNKLLEWAKNSKCNCYKNFLNEELAENDGKRPIERYYEFLHSVYNGEYSMLE